MELAILGSVIGFILGAFTAYKIINYNATKTQFVVVHNKTGNEYNVLGDVINATNDRDGQSMVLYGNDKRYFVRKTSEFKVKFSEKED